MPEESLTLAELRAARETSWKHKASTPAPDVARAVQREARRLAGGVYRHAGRVARGGDPIGPDQEQNPIVG